MVFEIRQLAGEPILVITAAPPTDAYADVKRKLADLEARVSTIDAPVIFRINDYSALPAPTLNDIMFVMAEETRTPRPGSAADPRVQNVVVGTHPMLKLATEGLKQTQFGGLDVPLFATYEAALAYVRAEIVRLNTNANADANTNAAPPPDQGTASPPGENLRPGA